MVIALIGMSGVGKSYWAEQLSVCGFTWFNCDEMIGKRLEKELHREGFASVQDIGRWLGQPYEEQYDESSAIYLKHERESMCEILEAVAHRDDTSTPVVIDTTGSVIYTGDDVLALLKQHSTVVYLHTPQEVQDVMYAQYLADPKPVIWGPMFSQEEDESKDEALARCYPRMLEARTREYKRLADHTLGYDVIRREGMGVEEIIEKIRKNPHNSNT